MRIVHPTLKTITLLIGPPSIVLAMLSLATCSSSGSSVSSQDSITPTSPSSPKKDGEVKIKNPGYIIEQEFPLNINVSSTVFDRIHRIPIEYTCTKNEYYPEVGPFRFGENKSPPLSWAGGPPDTKSYALVMYDPDVAAKDTVIAGIWIHWVIWNIPSDINKLPERISTTTQVLSIGSETRQGTNAYKEIGWSGPCPGENLSAIQGRAGRNINSAHDYTFTLYALDTVFSIEELPPGSTHQDLLKKIDGHILAAGTVIGEYVNKIRYR